MFSRTCLKWASRDQSENLLPSRLYEGRRTERQPLWHSLLCCYCKLKVTCFALHGSLLRRRSKSVSVFGRGRMGMCGIYHFFLRSPGVVSPCEVTFEFTIPLRKAINSQINIPLYLSLPLSCSRALSLTHTYPHALALLRARAHTHTWMCKAIEKTKEIALRKRLYY